MRTTEFFVIVNCDRKNFIGKDHNDFVENVIYAKQFDNYNSAKEYLETMWNDSIGGVVQIEKYFKIHPVFQGKNLPM